MEAGAIKLSELSLIQKQRLNDYPDRRTAKSGPKRCSPRAGEHQRRSQTSLADSPTSPTPPGNAANGKAVFTKNCAVCHRYQGEGASVGPDLSGMAVHGKQQLLVHILDPNRDVEGNYQAYIVVLRRRPRAQRHARRRIGHQHRTDRWRRQTPRDPPRRNRRALPDRHVAHARRIREATIASRVADLLEFLTAAHAIRAARLRRVATVSSARGMFQTPDSEVERLVFDDWGTKTFAGVPFYPRRSRRMAACETSSCCTATSGPSRRRCRTSVELPCGFAAKAIHFLSGVSGWGFPARKAGSVSMIVRLHYADGATEDHALINGVHFADYLGHTDVNGSKLAFSFGRQQLRYFKIEPKRSDAIETVELIKGPDRTAPVVMGITAEQR